MKKKKDVVEENAVATIRFIFSNRNMVKNILIAFSGLVAAVMVSFFQQ
jgi:hypothetical protein